MTLEKIERAIKATFTLTDRKGRGLKDATPDMEDWPLTIFVGLAVDFDFSINEIAEYLGYFSSEIREFNDTCRLRRLTYLMGLYHGENPYYSLHRYETKYVLTRRFISAQNPLNLYDHYQK
jgi:hypothetical protein